MSSSDSENLDVVDFFSRSYGTKVSSDSTQTDCDGVINKWDRHDAEAKPKPSKNSFPGKWKSVQIPKRTTRRAELQLQTVIIPDEESSEGQLIRALEIPWRSIVNTLSRNWDDAFSISPRMWEEIIAAAFDQAGYDSVTLTPQSGDFGRDVIAVKHGIGCIRIIDSVKAYSPHQLVRHDDVRALAGVLHGDPNATKGILSTTSDFAPGIRKDPFLKPLMPYRLELMNGKVLQQWLKDVSKIAG